MLRGLRQLTARPTIAFIFYSGDRVEWTAAVADVLPPSIPLLATRTNAVQANVLGHLQGNSTLAVMLGAFPEATGAAFCLDTPERLADPYTTVREATRAAAPALDDERHKVRRNLHSWWCLVAAWAPSAS